MIKNIINTGNEFFTLPVLNFALRRTINGMSHKILKILRDVATSTELSLN